VAHGRSASTAPVPENLEVQFHSLEEARARGFELVDVRDPQERAAEPLSAPAIQLPMSHLLAAAANLDLAGRYLFVCATGKRSAAAAELLCSQGFRDCRSLQGGLKRLKAVA
jgi:rhodanese-related sulfurtransferase